MKTYYDDGTIKIRSMLPEDAKILYDTYFKEIFNPETTPDGIPRLKIMRITTKNRNQAKESYSSPNITVR